MLQTLPPGAALRGWRMVEMEELLPIKTHHREDGTELNNKGKGVHEGIALWDTQQVLGDNHMTRRGDWQELSQSFNDGNNNCLNPIHLKLSTNPSVCE